MDLNSVLSGIHLYAQLLAVSLNPSLLHLILSSPPGSYSGILLVLTDHVHADVWSVGNQSTDSICPPGYVCTPFHRQALLGMAVRQNCISQHPFHPGVAI